MSLDPRGGPGTSSVSGKLLGNADSQARPRPPEFNLQDARFPGGGVAKCEACCSREFLLLGEFTLMASPGQVRSAFPATHAHPTPENQHYQHRPAAEEETEAWRRGRALPNVSKSRAGGSWLHQLARHHPGLPVM